MQFIKVGADTYKQNNGLIPIRTAFKFTHSASSERKLDWEGALIRYRKTNTRIIKEPTWKKKHLPVLEGVMFYMNKAKYKPQNSKTLHKKVFNEYVHGKYKQITGWELGTTQRRHMRLAFNKFLDYCCNNEEFPSHWRPLDPKIAGERDDLIGKNKRIGYPLTDPQIGRLVDNFRDNDQAQRWKFAVQLCAVYGLRPEELNYLVLRNNKSELWCTYQKTNSSFKERKLLPFLVRDIDGKAFDWCYNLVQRLAAGEKLPEIPKGKGGQYLGEYLRKKSIKNVWKSLCEERTKKYEELTGQSRTQYIDDQLKIKEETIKGYEKIKKEAEENPDKNIWDNDYVDMRKLHFARLEKYGRSTFNGETYYVGSKGGIYTLSANGTRNYKY